MTLFEVGSKFLDKLLWVSFVKETIFLQVRVGFKSNGDCSRHGTRFRFKDTILLF
jgi:hypothetical protein